MQRKFDYVAVDLIGVEPGDITVKVSGWMAEWAYSVIFSMQLSDMTGKYKRKPTQSNLEV